MIKLRCKKCKNKWNYKGDNKYYATCSRCLNKVRINLFNIIKEADEK